MEEKRPAISGKTERIAVHFIFSHWMVLLLAIAIVSPWLVIAFLLTSRNAVSRNLKASLADATSDAATSAPVLTSADPPPEEWMAGTKGPWGRIDSMLFAIDVPDEFVVVPPPDQPPVRWSFPGYTKEKVLATLRSVGLPEDEVNTLDRGAKWGSDDGVASVEPGDLLILSLAPEVRSKLYAILVTFPQNARQIDPIWFRPGKVDYRLKDCELAPESIALLKRLLYPQGENMLLFADFEPALRSLANDAERRHFVKAVSRKRAVLAHVRLDHDADVEKIVAVLGHRRTPEGPFAAPHRAAPRGKGH